MICVTGSESNIEGLRERQTRLSTADLHEIRLDHLANPDQSMHSVIVGDPSRVLITCRPLREGGLFEGDESQRLEILRRAAAFGVGFVDLEADVDEDAARLVLDEAAKGSTRVIRSKHFFESGADARKAMEHLRHLRGNLLKLAIAVEDAAELAPLFELGVERDRPVVLIGMGFAGMLSRVCYRRFGSAWTYVAEQETQVTAPGQLSWQHVEQWRLAGGRDPAPVVLLGGQQIAGSPGPYVYNQLFAQRSLPWVYLPVVTQEAARTLRLLKRLGFIGASVTMPLKESFFEEDLHPDEDVRAIGALNTLWWDSAKRLCGANTDGLGAVRAIESQRALKGRQVLLLGAGGTARAIAWSLIKCSARVAIWNRTIERAQELVESLNSKIATSLVSVCHRPAELTPEIIINATSMGLRKTGEQDGVFPELPNLTGTCLLDCVAQPPRTEFLERGASLGATTISGVDMWLQQGAAQVALWTGEPIQVEALRALLPRHTNAALGTSPER